MKRQIFRTRFLLRLGIVPILVTFLFTLSPSPAAAQDLSDYFEYEYQASLVDAGGNPKTEVHGNESFYARTQGTVTCVEDLPFPYDQVSQVRLTFNVVAELQDNGAETILNPGYTTTVNPFPISAGETYTINELIPLIFPQESQSGGYNVIAKLSKAEAKAFDTWLVIPNDQIPEDMREQFLGLVTYIATPNIPSNPSPAHQAGNIPINADLSWTGGDPDAGDTVTYDVYFGTTATPPQVSNDQPGTTYDPGVLNYDTKYYWQIVATNNHGVSIQSPVWEFTTIDSPGPTIVWNCPLAYTAWISPYPNQGRPPLTKTADLFQVTKSTPDGWFQCYHRDALGNVTYYDSLIGGGTLTQLEINEYYYVVVSDPCTIQIPQW